MARLNRDAPFDAIGGLPGAAYSQNGRLFNPAGFEVETYEVGEGDQKRTLCRAKQDANQNLTVDEEEDAKAADAPVTAASMHWRQLKALVESYGHKFTNRQDALRFLENREPETEGDVTALEDTDDVGR
jgi:hypothetical protein